VVVVPTTSVIDALAALVGYDPDAPAETNVDAMNEALSRVRSGEVTQAVRDSVGECGPIKQGDWIALSRDGIHAAAASALDAMTALFEYLVDEDSEIVTVLCGTDANAADTNRMREYLEFKYPNVEVEFHEGGQPLYPYLVGVE
jgi:dihydroxyacetone kinase-like predicted kinase